MKISQLPDLPGTAGSVDVPCVYNGADYKTTLVTNSNTLPVYQSGDSISGYLYGSGYITSDSKSCVLTLPMPKVFASGATVSLTSLLVSVRVVNGGYLGATNGIDLTAKVTSTTCSGTALVISLSQLSAFSYGTGGNSSGTVTNNTPVAGYVSISATVI